MKVSSPKLDGRSLISVLQVFHGVLLGEEQIDPASCFYPIRSILPVGVLRARAAQRRPRIPSPFELELTSPSSRASKRDKDLPRTPIE